MVSEICRTFGCLPDEAERQQSTLVYGVMDCRNLRSAVDWFNGGQEGMEKLQEHPELLELMREVKRAMGTDEDEEE